jgi:hypothetical protein
VRQSRPRDGGSRAGAGARCAARPPEGAARSDGTSASPGSARNARVAGVPHAQDPGDCLILAAGGTSLGAMPLSTSRGHAPRRRRQPGRGRTPRRRARGRRHTVAGHRPRVPPAGEAATRAFPRTGPGARRPRLQRPAGACGWNPVSGSAGRRTGRLPLPEPTRRERTVGEVLASTGAGAVTDPERAHLTPPPGQAQRRRKPASGRRRARG